VAKFDPSGKVFVELRYGFCKHFVCFTTNKAKERNTNMKKSTLIIIVAVAALISQLIGIQPLGAQQFFKASVNAVGVSTNHSGEFTQHLLRGTTTSSVNAPWKRD
jgi:hypothetical protein